MSYEVAFDSLEETYQLELEQQEDKTKPPFVHLQQLYEFEFAPITKYEANEHGLYPQEELCSHWSKFGVDIYVVYAQHKGKKIPIGFAVVNLASMINVADQKTRDIAEFFVLPLWRRKKIGEWMAFELFKKYPGSWEVRQLPDLEKAHQFWVKTICAFTQGDFSDSIVNNLQWQGHVQTFQSRKK